jgi:hypothetical protein
MGKENILNRTGCIDAFHADGKFNLQKFKRYKAGGAGKHSNTPMQTDALWYKSL